MLQAVWVFSITAISRSATGLHISSVPILRSYRAQKRGGMERPRAYFHIKGLQDHAALVCPKLL